MEEARWKRVEEIQAAGVSTMNAALSVERVERKGYSYLTDGAGPLALGELVWHAMDRNWTVSVDSDFPAGGMLKVEDPEHPSRGQS